VSAPAILIRIELERLAPRLLTEAFNEHEHQALVDWLDTQPRLLQLVQAAIALENECGSS
jgi:hypothetical protein